MHVRVYGKAASSDDKFPTPGSPWTHRVIGLLDSICVINNVLAKMAGNIIIGEEMNAANLFKNLNRIWQTEMWNLGEGLGIFENIVIPVV